MNKILLVEDDKSLGPALKTTLENHSFEVTLCENLALARAQNLEEYNLLLLDWMLPDGQGIDFLKEVDKKLPVIMLTARADLIDKVLGLESGASDYITKPFEARELIARIRVQLRQPTTQGSDTDIETVERSGLYLNINERIAKFNNEGIKFHLVKLSVIVLSLCQIRVNYPKNTRYQVFLELFWKLQQRR